MSYIQIKSVSKKYGDLTAVDNISFEIKEGELFGLLGPNGAGKSTLISVITTLIKPTGGQILVNGLDIKTKQSEVKKILGLVPQDIALYPTLTAGENLAFWGKMYGLDGKLLKERIKEALEIAGLSDRAKNRIDSFSGVMKRRINIAAALLHKPKVLIMDEPTVGIDPQSRNHILETVQKLNKEGMTVIYTSHYMEEIEFLCSYIGIMDHGKIIAMGTKEELRKLVSNKDVIKIKLMNENDSAFNAIKKLDNVDNITFIDGELSINTGNADTVLAKIISTLESAKCKIQKINIEQSNLESVFLHLTGRALRD
jgi:ABC-2 type transport system ATP-binding protein